MSGIDRYTRFYATFDDTPEFGYGNIASAVLTTYSGEAWWEYNWDTNEFDIYDEGGLRFPSLTLSAFDSVTGQHSPCKFSGEVGFHAYSTIPSDGVNPTRQPSVMYFSDNPIGPAGLSGYAFGEYTIDFWFQLNPEADPAQSQAIITNSNNGWMLYYEDGKIGQIQGTDHHVACAVDFTDYLPHHVEFNRSFSGEAWVNRIFVDGSGEDLTSNSWLPIYRPSDRDAWFIGSPYSSTRGVDHVVDELRFSTGIARHTSNFDVPTEHYTADFPPTEIPSPTDGSIEFIPNLSLEYFVPPKTIVPAITDGRIRIEGLFSQALSLGDDPYILATQNGRIRFESLLESYSGFYGLTVPAIIDGAIEFESLLEIECSIESPIIVTVIPSGTLYDLIENAIQLPMSLEVSIFMDTSGWTPPTFEYRFLNSLLAEFGFRLLNALNTDIETEFVFKNKMTESLTVTFILKNKLLVLNEVSKEFIFRNRLDSASGSEAYDGFYFSKIHGV